LYYLYDLHLDDGCHAIFYREELFLPREKRTGQWAVPLVENMAWKITIFACWWMPAGVSSPNTAAFIQGIFETRIELYGHHVISL